MIIRVGLGRTRTFRICTALSCRLSIAETRKACVTSSMTAILKNNQKLLSTSSVTHRASRASPIQPWYSDRSFILDALWGEVAARDHMLGPTAWLVQDSRCMLHGHRLGWYIPPLIETAIDIELTLILSWRLNAQSWRVPHMRRDRGCVSPSLTPVHTVNFSSPE